MDGRDGFARPAVFLFDSGKDWGKHVMEQAGIRKIQMRRLQGRAHAWLSKPANVILMIFLVALTLLTLYPLLSMLTAITLTRYMLKLMIDSKISTNANAYGANGYMLMDKRPGQKEDTANA